ncbi:flavodoxin family protein [Candidatus Micrarchaeota archaeon]|nr:flavodoxin family protein [Candidatus Micrarchaeota archaeon]
MKILAISGSHRNSNTDAMLNEFVKGCRKNRANVKLVLLRKLNPKVCCGWSDCYYENYCIVKDEMQKLYVELEKADAWVLASPTYFDAVSTYMKIFIDRLNPYCKPPRYRGKKIFLICVGGAGLRSTKRCERALKRFCYHLKVKVIGSVLGVADHEREILKNKVKLKECFNAGARFVAQLK